MLRAQQYDDHEAQINILARMEGNGHHWYCTYVWVDLPTFERDFMNRFDYVHPEQALYMIKDRVQKPLESVAEYRNRFYRMFVKIERVHSHHGLATGSDFRYSRAEEEAEEESEGELRREVGEAAARLAEDEEEEREAAEESAEAEEEEEEEAGEETSEEEEEAYSEHNEGEPSEEEYEDDDEEVESGDDQEPTRDDELEWVPGPDRREGSPEAAAQRKKEVAEGKRSAIDPPLNDSSKDLELPKPEHGNLAAMTSNVVTTRRRPRS
ncbi:hypothetical protein CBR_g11165 [Chara braunii]|uniref:Retrotransposon gag domain-containing protein n=1 Tax=Chara braunii TaxID=69332 RepID=A0A388KQM6_CHABU|nr:hypothetical protein CBR_g11165 [Chara braunii]|eukprot:GBG72233.1 hypothetical protein CBR_g11165 [Chara braunii]